MKKIILTLIIFALLCTTISAQRSSFKQGRLHSNRFFGPQAFLNDIYFFMSSSDKAMTKVKIYIGFCNDILQFIKKANDRFQAKYELTIAIFDKKGNHLSGKTSSDEIIVSSFPETNSRKITNRIDHVVELVADEYKFIIELTDLDTRKTLTREEKIDVREFYVESISISDIIFANEINQDTINTESIIPNLNKTFNDPKSNFGAYFEIYPISLTDSLKLTYRIIDATNTTISSKEEIFIPENYIIPYNINLDEQIEKVNKYTLEIEVEQKNIIGKTNGKFSTNWSYFGTRELNLQQALNPLKELISNKDWKWLEQQSDSAKEVWLEDYWKQRDPTPETEENELRDEFYKRVDFANFHFAVNTSNEDGWETDRGKIYIKYGQPTTIDRHVNEINVPPYEIWYYSSIDRRFIFEDRSSTGNYTLVKIE